jgi:plasmid stabilization system protein ParE
MARVEVTTRALADLERLFDFLAEHNPKLARERMVSVRRALELLADHPFAARNCAFAQIFLHHLPHQVMILCVLRDGVLRCARP